MRLDRLLKITAVGDIICVPLISLCCHVWCGYVLLVLPISVYALQMAFTEYLIAYKLQFISAIIITVIQYLTAPVGEDILRDALGHFVADQIRCDEVALAYKVGVNALTSIIFVGGITVTLLCTA